MILERQVTQTDNPWHGEHMNRYQLAVNYINSKHAKVLDIACGSGFGSFYLANLYSNVVGADISKEAIESCNINYQKKNLIFTIADGTSLPYHDETFDAITSFETIEHTTQFELMLSEFKRVIKKNGVLIISTPNRIVNSPSGIIENPYHTQEWDLNGLNSLLKNIFPNVVIYGQEYIRYKNKKKFNYKLGSIVESVLYQRGIRKLPLRFQDKIMKSIINEPMYPSPSNYALTENREDMNKCKTFFAICKLE